MQLFAHINKHFMPTCHGFLPNLRCTMYGATVTFIYLETAPFNCSSCMVSRNDFEWGKHQHWHMVIFCECRTTGLLSALGVGQLYGAAFIATVQQMFCLDRAIHAAQYSTQDVVNVIMLVLFWGQNCCKMYNERVVRVSVPYTRHEGIHHHTNQNEPPSGINAL